MARSEFTLPLSLAAGLTLWLVANDWHVLVWMLPMAMYATYVTMEMNNRLALIRIRTRIMASVFWLGLPLLLSPLTNNLSTFTDVLAALLLLPATCMLFFTYGRPDRVLTVFHVFALLGAAAVLCAPLAIFIPLFWLYLIIYMRAWTARVFSASLLGLALAAMLLLVVPGSLDQWSSLDGILGVQVSARMALILALGLCASIYYVRQSYDDKISIRMMYHVIIWQWLWAQALALAIPDRALTLNVATWVFATPLISHQIALSRSRWTTWWLIAVLLAGVAIQVIHHLDIQILPSLTSSSN